MPIGVILVLTFAIMAIKRGVDWPLAVTAMSLGDRSNGTILEGPVDMIGDLWDKVWKIAVEVFNRGDSTPPAALMHQALHVAQMTGVAG